MHEYLAQIEPELVALRHQLHQIPEAGLDLPQTQRRLLDELAKLPLELTTGESLSSITAVLRAGAVDGDTAPVLLRADMDALPVAEKTGLEWASTNGNMHACGHDTHMTMLVGAAKALCQAQDRLTNDVIFMFQPGEEGCDGASYMLEERVLEAAGKRPGAAYALHVWSASEEPCGTFTTKPGAMMASADVTKIEITGVGGHGSTPYRAVDPVPAMAEMITASHAMVTRNFDVFDPIVFTVGKAVAGTAPNVIPEVAHLETTLRAFNPATRDRAIQLIQRTFSGIAQAHGVEVSFDVCQSYPATINHPAETEHAGKVIEELFGAEAHVRWERPLPAAEDFSRVLMEVPGSFIGLAACPPHIDPSSAAYNHSAYAQFDDSVLVKGAELLAELALRGPLG